MSCIYIIHMQIYIIYADTLCSLSISHPRQTYYVDELGNISHTRKTCNNSSCSSFILLLICPNELARVIGSWTVRCVCSFVTTKLVSPFIHRYTCLVLTFKSIYIYIWDICKVVWGIYRSMCLLVLVVHVYIHMLYETHTSGRGGEFFH